MRKAILNVHLIIALVAGAFILMLGLTGTVLAFESDIDRLLHYPTAYVRPSGRLLSLGEVGAAVSQKYPGEPIVAFLPSESPGIATQVILSRGIVSVNQYTGEILGVRTRGQSFLGIVRALHVRLAMGDIGRFILKWSSLATLVSLISGLYLWWPVKRMRINGRRWSARFWYDLHSSIGFFSLLPALLLAGTGTVLGFENQVGWLFDKFSNSQPVAEAQSSTSTKSGSGGTPISPDQAVAIARAQLPGTLPYRVQMPQYGGFYVIALDDPQNRVTGGRNFISLDASGRIVSQHLSSDLQLRERFLALNGAIHTGSFWGMSSRIITAFASMLLPLQLISGLLIWLRRKGIVHTS